MTEARRILLTADERPQVEISQQPGWKETAAMVVASALALALHVGIVLLLLANFSLFVPEPDESEDLEQQVIAIVEIAPQPELAPQLEPAPQEAPIDIGRVNQGQDTGDGEAAATGDLAALEPEPATPEPVPDPLPEEASPEPTERLAEIPLPSAPDEPLPETPLPPTTEATPPQEPDAVPPPLPGPPSELPEFALLERQEEPRDSSAEVPEEQVEDLTFDASLTEVLVTAAIERDAEETEPSGPLAVPPGKPEREVTLPEVPRPVTPRRQRTTRAEQSDRQSGRQAQNDSEEGGAGGGYGGGSEANYLGQVARVLNRQKVYPPEAKIRGEEGRVIVRFTLDEEGWVIARRVLRSSGHSRLDEEVMDLLIRASPLPPPPGRQERLTLTLTLRFYAS